MRVSTITIRFYDKEAISVSAITLRGSIPVQWVVRAVTMQPYIASHGSSALTLYQTSHSCFRLSNHSRFGGPRDLQAHGHESWPRSEYRSLKCLSPRDCCGPFEDESRVILWGTCGPEENKRNRSRESQGEEEGVGV
ncbi:hypothetical protein E2C01_055877 [Portunus trituberculatus]|uniref:Uncharacterized protein n=1 Tax=Portunus trituberculatus TaxID=210409 RepID=A0A5B7GNN0_PORTR|nr:hypothetical protein [Portunus trituberculatus]